MIIACPKCQQRHDVSQRRPGETFNCTCGNVLAAPKKGGVATWIIVLLVIAAGSVPCIGILAAIAIPNFIKYQLRTKSTEGRVNVMAIRTAEMAYFAEHDTFVAAGPVPAAIPGKKKAAFVADEGFRTLEWQPVGQVFHQYEVQLTGPKTAVVIARGDVDGDGVIAEYRVELGGDSPGTVTKSDENVF